MQHTRLVTSVLATFFAAVFSSPSLWAGVDPEPFRTGLFGVTEGQAIRISVFNDRVQKVCPSPDTVVASVVIRDLQGTPLFESHTKPIPDGRGAFVDFVPVSAAQALSLTGARTPGGATESTSRRRLQVRAEVVVASELPDVVPGAAAVDDTLAADREALARCREQVVVTLEVFDRATQGTAFTLPFAKVAFNPQPEPPEPIQEPQ